MSLQTIGLNFIIILIAVVKAQSGYSSTEQNGIAYNALNESGMIYDSSVQSTGTLNVTKIYNNGNTEFVAEYNLTKTVTEKCPGLDNVQNLAPQQVLQRLTAPCRYYRLQRPPCSVTSAGNCPVEVTARITVSSLNIKSQEPLTLKVNALLQLKYFDARLAFGSYVPQINKPILVEASIAKRLWLPHLTLINQLNEVGTSAQSLLNSQIVYIHPNGTVLVSTSFQAQLNCMVGFQSFPLDEQICHTTLQSWIYSASDVLLEWTDEESLTVHPASNLNPYTLTDYWTSQSTLAGNSDSYQSSNSTEVYSALSISLRLSRDLSISVVTYFIPSMMIVANSWIAFWLQPDQTPARATFGTSTLLSFVTLSITQQSDVPNPFYRKMSSIWFICCFLFIFGSLMEFAFVNVVWRRTRVVILRRLNLKYMFKLTSRPRINKPLPVAHDCEYCTRYLAGMESRNQNKRSTTTLVTVSTIETDTTTICGDYPGEQENCSCPTRNEPNVDDDDDNIAVVMSPHEAGLWLDRKARFLFPFVFVLFNAVFWALVLCL